MGSGNCGLIQGQLWAFSHLTFLRAPLSFPPMKTLIASIDVEFFPGTVRAPATARVPDSLLLLGLIRGCRVR